MMAEKLGNLVPASPANLKSRETTQPAFAEDEYRFAQMFEDDLKNHRQREKEQAEVRQAETDEEEEQMLRTSETVEQVRRNHNKEKQERSGMEKGGNKASANDKPKAESEAAGKETKQDEKVKAEGTSQTKDSGGEAGKATKTENSAGNSEKSSKTASQKAGTANSKVQPGLIDAVAVDDAELSSTITQNGKAPKANNGSSLTLNSNLTGGKSAEMASEKLAGAISGQDQGKKTKVNNPPGGNPGKAATGTEGTPKAQNQQKPETLLQDLQKNSTAKKTESKLALAPRVAQDSKNGQVAQKLQIPQTDSMDEGNQQNLRLFGLGTERRPVSLYNPADRAEFIRLLASDKQGQQSGISASVTGKAYTADTEIKVQDGGASASDNNEQQKEFKFSLNNTISSTNDSGSVKRKVLQKLVNLMRQQQAQRNQQTEIWQKHRFVMDDGKAIHVASRNAEGLLTLQLGVQNQELNKLIQQHLQEIKAHLQEQFGMDIDVQLQNSGQQGDSEFSEEQADGGHSFTDAALAGTDSALQAERQAPRIRNLGFNTNEWIA